MATLTQDVKQLVQEKAKAIRVGIVQSVTAAKSGHPGGSLSIADVMALLYYVEMNVDPANPKAPNRDRFVLSKGHAAPALYATLAEKGYYNRIISGNILQRVVIDSVRCNFNSYPYQVETFAKQFVTRASNITERSLITSCRLINSVRSDNNPQGFIIEQFNVIENKDLRTVER